MVLLSSSASEEMAAIEKKSVLGPEKWKSAAGGEEATLALFISTLALFILAEECEPVRRSPQPTSR